MNASYESYDTLVDLLESIEHFVMRLDIYTRVTHTPTLDEMANKIIVELLSTLALVTKELKQGRMSKSTPIEELPYSIQRRKMAFWREGYRGGATEGRSALARCGSVCRSGDFQSDSRSSPECKWSHGW